MSLALSRRGSIRHPGGLFAFPGTNPGFDPAHPLAAKTQLSAVASGANFINLLSGTPAANGGGAPSAKVINPIGGAVNFSGSTDGLKFTGQSTASVSACTLAAIVQFSGYNSGQYQVLLGATTSGLLCLSSDANHFLTLYAGGPTFSTFVPSLNVPYFLALSAVNPNGSSMNFVAMNLLTGAFFSQKTPLLTNITAPTGTANIGNNNFAAQGANGAIAAVMYRSQFASMQDLTSWAHDPWSFWYPRQ